MGSDALTIDEDFKPPHWKTLMAGGDSARSIHDLCVIENLIDPCNVSLPRLMAHIESEIHVDRLLKYEREANNIQVANLFGNR